MLAGLSEDTLQKVPESAEVRHTATSSVVCHRGSDRGGRLGPGLLSLSKGRHEPRRVPVCVTHGFSRVRFEVTSIGMMRPGHRRQQDQK